MLFVVMAFLLSPMTYGATYWFSLKSQLSLMVYAETMTEAAWVEPEYPIQSLLPTALLPTARFFSNPRIKWIDGSGPNIGQSHPGP